MGHRQHNLLHPVGGQIEEYNKKTTFTQRLVLGKGSFLVSETRWYCNLVRCIVGLRVCLFWEGNIFRSPLWLVHLSGMLTMWMSELKQCAHVCEREKERDQESERLRERRRGCPFDQALIIGPGSSLDIDLELSSCQPTTFLLFSFHFHVEMATALWCLATRQNSAIIRPEAEFFCVPFVFCLFVLSCKCWLFLTETLE